MLRSLVLSQRIDSDADAMDHHAGCRQLLIDSRKYAEEHRWASWWNLGITLLLQIALVCIVVFYDSFFIRVACSWLISLTIVRIFIIYHDFLHGAILKRSPLARCILHFYGHLMLTPPSVWKRSHDHHHQHNSKLHGPNIGSFPIMTKAGYLAASPAEQRGYRWARSPMIIVCGYFIVFLFGMCILPLASDFRKNASALLTLTVHFGTLLAGVYFLGLSVTIFAFALPAFLAMLMGTYLFYVQHNFPDAQIQASQDWTYADAALISSSHLSTGTLLQWFLGNIGLHHVHHLNSKIPFYRLPEAMQGLPQMQDPGTTSFALKDIAACLRLKLWDNEAQRLVPYPVPVKPQ